MHRAVMRVFMRTVDIVQSGVRMVVRMRMNVTIGMAMRMNVPRRNRGIAYLGMGVTLIRRMRMGRPVLMRMQILTINAGFPRSATTGRTHLLSPAYYF
jgi:hypothetical protein